MKRHWVDIIWQRVERWEKKFFRFIVLTVLMLVIIQSFLVYQPLRLFLTFDEIMDTSGGALFDPSIPVHQIIALPGTITVEVKGVSFLSQAYLLINDERVGDFREGKISIPVRPGDKISIDTAYYQRPQCFEIIRVSNNIDYPRTGQIIETNGNIVTIGKVKVK